MDVKNSVYGSDVDTFATNFTPNVSVRKEAIADVPTAIRPSLAAHRMSAAFVDCEEPVGLYATAPLISPSPAK